LSCYRSGTPAWKEGNRGRVPNYTVTVFPTQHEKANHNKNSCHICIKKKEIEEEEKRKDKEWKEKVKKESERREREKREKERERKERERRSTQ
jgi:hypothetical protein